MVRINIHRAHITFSIIFQNMICYDFIHPSQSINKTELITSYINPRENPKKETFCIQQVDTYLNFN
ncbi:hypothetical protein Hanom_Chr10g00950071 [Helianthus anomalus]